MESQNRRILVSDHEAGTLDETLVSKSKTAQQYLLELKGSGWSERMSARLNGQLLSETGNQAFSDGDELTLSPRKVGGA